MIKKKHANVHIGIIEATAETENLLTRYWWCKTYGYTYFATGCVYSGNVQDIYKAYGEKYGKGDIIDIWLDLEHNDCLSFCKNGKNLGKAFDVKSNTNYRFGIGVNTNTNSKINFKMEITSFEIEN